MEKKLKHQYVPPDLEELEEYQTKKEVKELPHHTVTITDISEVDLAGQGGLRLGRNQVGYYMIFCSPARSAQSYCCHLGRPRLCVRPRHTFG